MTYERIGPEAAYLTRAMDLRAYHGRLGGTDSSLDRAVTRDLHQQLLDDYADVIPYNRRLTLRRYTHRARAVSCLLLSLLFALLATMLVLVGGKTGLFVKV